MKRLNILHFSSLGIWDIKPGAGRVSTYLPLKGQIDRGHSVTFISSYGTVKTGDYEGIKCRKIWIPFSKSRPFIRLLMLPLSDFCFFFKGFSEARKEKPDIVYCHCTISVFPAFIIAKLFDAKFVIRLYGTGTAAFSKKKYPSYLFRKRCLKHKADAYILANDGTASDKLAIRLGVSKEKIHFLKNGIKKVVDLTKDEQLKKSLAPHGEKIVITVSRLQNGKQVDLIIKMMPKLVKFLPVKLAIIGDGPEKEALNNLVDELNVRENVIFLGGKKQREVYRYLNVADVFVSMNYLSSMSNPVFEAMICGKPVVALNKGTTTDLIHHNENGIVIEEEQLCELPVMVAELLQDDERLTKIGQNARQYMLDNWPTWEERVKQEVDLIEKL